MRRTKKKKGSKGQEVKSPTPTQAIDALISDEEQNKKYKKEEKERNTEQDLNTSTLDIWLTLMTRRGRYI